MWRFKKITLVRRDLKINHFKRRKKKRFKKKITLGRGGGRRRRRVNKGLVYV